MTDEVADAPEVLCRRKNKIRPAVPEGTTEVSIYTNTGNDITVEHAPVLCDAAASYLCGE